MFNFQLSSGVDDADRASGVFVRCDADFRGLRDAARLLNPDIPYADFFSSLLFYHRRQRSGVAVCPGFDREVFQREAVHRGLVRRFTLGHRRQCAEQSGVLSKPVVVAQCAVNREVLQGLVVPVELRQIRVVDSIERLRRRARADLNALRRPCASARPRRRRLV